MNVGEEGRTVPLHLSGAPLPSARAAAPCRAVRDQGGNSRDRTSWATWICISTPWEGTRGLEVSWAAGVQVAWERQEEGSFLLGVFGAGPSVDP